MNSQKGFTLVAVTVYVIVIAIVIGVIAMITSFFYSNTKYIDDSGENAAQFDTFNMFFLEDVRKEGNEIVGLAEDTTTSKTITFSDGTTYTIKEGGIYRDKVKICNNVSDESQFKFEAKDGKILVTANLTFGDTFAKNVQYLAKGHIRGAYGCEIAGAENVNAPDLTSNMTPVMWDGTEWIAIDASDPSWYDYAKGENRWANVVIGNYDVGTSLGDGSNVDMYVWIPRFEYDPDEISIRFVSGTDINDLIHPAFTKRHIDSNDNVETIEVPGFWISKYRITTNSSSKPYQESLKVNFRSFYSWWLATIFSDSLEIANDLLNEGKILELQNNTTYGAMCFLTLCALDGGMPSEVVESQDTTDEVYSTTGNMTGVYGMNCAEGQLVATLYSTQEYPNFDDNLSDAIGVEQPTAGRMMGNIDNASPYISELTERRFLGTGIMLDSSWEEISDYGQTYLRGVDGNMLGARVTSLEEESTFHFVITEYWAET